MISWGVNLSQWRSGLYTCTDVGNCSASYQNTRSWCHSNLSWSFQNGFVICNLHGSGWYIICKSQIDVQFSNIWPFFTFSNRRPITSLTYTSNDVTPVRECLWSNDGEGTRPDSRWGVLDDKRQKCLCIL